LRPRAFIAAALAASAVLACGGAHAFDSLRLCDREGRLSSAQQDVLLRFAAAAREVLDASGARVALVARSGLNLARFDIRYSHAGVALRTNAGWQVRQLYYACDERRARLYDQGVAGFLFGTDDASLGHLSIVLLPDAAARALDTAARDDARALALVHGEYSANAYPYGLRTQNCNQWLAELLAAAWGDRVDDRASAQAWLAGAGYAPPHVPVRSRALLFAAGFVPWLRTDDHPPDDVQAMRFRVSLPASIETFVRAREPGARRIELCHDSRRIVVREGWQPVDAGCVPAEGDRVIALD
jgi:hypothetical protein